MLLLLFFIILHALHVTSEEPTCKTTEKCLCLHYMDSGHYRYQCPSNSEGAESETVINVYPTSKKIKLNCFADILDDTVLPTENFENITSLEILDCPIPKNGFQDVLNHFNLINLENLMFVAQKSNSNLKSEDLDGLQNLKTLELRNVHTKSINEIFFDHTPNLYKLLFDESNVNLNNNEAFKNLPNLLYLSLYGNKMKDIPLGVFKYIRWLKSLDLRSNNLLHLKNGLFANLTHLESLELMNNKMQRIDDGVFDNLTQLSVLSLRRNDIRNISRRLIGNCTKLRRVLLNENRHLRLVDDVFSNFPFLEEVSLKQTGLKSVSSTIFSGSSNLKKIYLSDNKLTTLPSNLFGNLRKLKELHLGGNDILELPPDIFASLESLKILNLQKNQIRDLDEGILSHLVGLTEINLSYNQITRLPSGLLTRTGNLQKFFMSHNNFDFENSRGIARRYQLFGREACLNLQEVDLSYNNITKYPEALHNIVSMTDIKLDHNRIEKLKMIWLVSFNDNLKINLNHNRISSIDFAFFDRIQSKFHSKVSMANNAIYCDCRAIDWAKYVRYWNDPIVFLNSGNLYCDGPRELSSNLLEDAPFPKMICALGNNCTTEDSCSCSYRSIDSTVVVDCRNRQLQEMPQLRLQTWSEHYDFITMNQTEIHLENNSLARGPMGDEGYDNVTQLYLGGNKLRNITWLPANIQTLDLSDNKFEAMDAVSMKLLNESSVNELKFGKNPWKCDCQLKNFSLFLKKHNNQLDLLDIKCNGSSKLLVDLNVKDLCATKSYLIPILVVILLLSIPFAILTTSLYYKHKVKILIWMYSRGMCLWMFTEDEMDKDRDYDAFICYSSFDEEFLAENIVPVLEGGDKPFKLCIAVRDFVPGAPIGAQITDVINRSKRTIVLLSPNFLESIWTKMEFRTAHNEAMLEGRARVILIILGDIDEDSLDDDMKAYMKTHTYIKWGDPWFWKKMNYAMPRRKTEKLSNRHANMMQFIDDKFKLVDARSVTTTNEKSSVILSPVNLEEKSLTCIA